MTARRMRRSRERSFMRKNEPRIKIVELSRNFGHHAAILAGLAHAGGELIFFLDSDLEEPPEILRSFIEEMQREKADVVFGVHDRSQGRLFHRWTGGAILDSLQHDV